MSNIYTAEQRAAYEDNLNRILLNHYQYFIISCVKGSCKEYLITIPRRKIFIALHQKTHPTWQQRTDLCWLMSRPNRRLIR